MELKNHFGWKVTFALLGIVLLSGIVTVSILRDRIVNVSQYQVSVVGQGKISYQPDIANITIGVQIDKVLKADDALKQMNDKMVGVVKALKAAGIKDEDLRTQNYSLLPQYDTANSAATVLSGYSANEQLVVKVRNIKDNPTLVGQIVEVASRAGANQILGISYDLTNLEDLKQQARVLAIVDAQKKAKVLAKASDIKLGKIVGWWENLVQAPGYMNGSYYSLDSGKGGIGGGGVATASVPTGTYDIIIEMNINYKIE
jgi:hypothetical protein